MDEAEEQEEVEEEENEKETETDKMTLLRWPNGSQMPRHRNAVKQQSKQFNYGRQTAAQTAERAIKQ